MKNLVCFCLVVLVSIASCKKEVQQQGPCDGVVCLNGGHCENGVCVCDIGYSGTHCEIYGSCYHVQCGAHSHCEYGVCVCDGGWFGVNCNIPACAYNHTGAVLFINHGNYVFEIQDSTYDVIAAVGLNSSITIGNQPAGSNQYSLKSTTDCYVPQIPTWIPCKMYFPLLTINECDTTTYIIQ